MMELRLPYPPSVNHYWRRVGARTLISREGRRFRQRVTAILAAMHIQPMAGRLALQVEVYPPDGRRRDLDNCLKSLLDALERGGMFLDDSQIADLRVRRCAVVPGGKVAVTLQQMKEE